MTSKTGRKRRSPFASGLLAGGIATTLLLVLAAAAFAAEALFVVQKEASIRSKKSLVTGSALAKVHERDELTKIGEEGSWYRVEFLGVEGWIPKSAVSDDKDIVFSGEALASGVHATEQSAGGRGFNPQVEEKYRAQRTDLNSAYAIVDAIEKRKVPEDKVTRFVLEGKLGDAGVADAGASLKTPLASRPSAPAAARPARSGSTATSKTGGGQTAPWKR